jgi:hypothetical protein
MCTADSSCFVNSRPSSRQASLSAPSDKHFRLETNLTILEVLANNLQRISKMETTKGSRRKSTQQKSNSNDEDDRVLRQKLVKRRIQNRNSQKCYREKQVSYIRTLEKIVSNVVPATDPVSSSQTSQSQLLLIKENQELQDALLRMRKKAS